MRIPRVLTAFAALLLAFAPTAARAQADDDQPGLEVLRESEQRPLEQLMAVRDQLQLSDAQVTRLRAIAARLEETNRPLRRELLAQYQQIREQRRQQLERMTPAERQAELRRLRESGPPPVPPRLRPLVMRIRGNVRGAVREAGGVLTPGQRARVRQLVRERAIERRGRGMGVRGRRGGRGGWGGRP
jgi:hypothetical protein